MTAPETQAAAPERWYARHVGVLSLALVVAAVLGWILRRREILLPGDETVYLSLSESLANGRYHDEYLAGTPRHVQYPPGLPLWMLLLRTLLGPDLDILRAGNLFLGLVTALLIADLVRRLAGAWPGVAAGAIVAVSPLLLGDVAGNLLAEPLYAAFTALALWAAHRAQDRDAPGWHATALVAGLAGVLTRVPGVAVLAGIAAGWLLRGQWRTLVGGVLAMALVVGGWFGYVRRAAAVSIARTYAEDFAARESTAISAELLRMADNARIYATQVIPHSLQVPAIPGTPIDNLVVLAVLGTLTIAGVVTCLRRSPAVAGTLLAYGVMLCYWVWPNERYFTPVLPVLVAALVVGAQRLGELIPRRGRGAPLLALLALVLLPGLVGGIRRAPGAAACEAARAANPRACYPEWQLGYFEAMDFVRTDLPQTAVILGGRPWMTHYLTGRLALPTNLLRHAGRGEHDDILRELGASHLLLGPAQPGDASDSLAEATRPYCRALLTVASFPGTLILGPRHPGSDARDACVDIEAYTTLVAELSPGSAQGDTDGLP